MAERAGFEPAMRQRRIPVFETGAFNHSAISPQVRLAPATGARAARRADGNFCRLARLLYIIVPQVATPARSVVRDYRTRSDSPDMVPVLAYSHDRIRNLATNTSALWLLESGISARRPEKNPYAIDLTAIPIRPVCGMLAGGAGPPALVPNPPSRMPERCYNDKTG